MYEWSTSVCLTMSIIIETVFEGFFKGQKLRHETNRTRFESKCMSDRKYMIFMYMDLPQGNYYKPSSCIDMIIIDTFHNNTSTVHLYVITYRK
jgi:hypothetical protein